MRTKFSDRGKEKTVWISAPLHSKKAASKERGRCPLHHPGHPPQDGEHQGGEDDGLL
ncbi:MAG: hypothetical protein ACLR0P_09350 [Oscillospiraceae bacterium]